MKGKFSTVLHSSQLNSASFTHLMPVEKFDRWMQTKVLKLPPQKSVVHPESEVRDFVCLMRAGGPDTGSEQQKGILCIEGRARLTSFSQKKGKCFLGAGVPRQRSMEEAESVSAGPIRYCKSRKTIKSKRKRGLGWTKI